MVLKFKTVFEGVNLKKKNLCKFFILFFSAVTRADMSHYYHATYAVLTHQPPLPEPTAPPPPPPPFLDASANEVSPGIATKLQQQPSHSVYAKHQSTSFMSQHNSSETQRQTPTPVYSHSTPPSGSTPVDWDKPYTITSQTAFQPEVETTPIAIESISLQKDIEALVGVFNPEKDDIAKKLLDPLTDLPPGWKWARDVRKRIYFYHVIQRVSQWLPPPPDHLFPLSDSSDSSDFDEKDDQNKEETDDVTDLEAKSAKREDIDKKLDLQQIAQNKAAKENTAEIKKQDKIRKQVEVLMSPEELQTSGESVHVDLSLRDNSVNTNRDILQKMDGINGCIFLASARRRKKRIRNGLVQEKIISVSC